LRAQAAVIEFSRNAMGWAGAHSEEFDKTAKHQVP
jgi:CTP synthase (UTP-ammonia lyase)